MGRVAGEEKEEEKLICCGRWKWIFCRLFLSSDQNNIIETRLGREEGESSLCFWRFCEEHEKLSNPKRSFLEIRGIDENWEFAGDEGIMRYFGLLVEADYELPLTENGRMLEQLKKRLLWDDKDKVCIF